MVFGEGVLFEQETYMDLRATLLHLSINMYKKANLTNNRIPFGAI